MPQRHSERANRRAWMLRACAGCAMVIVAGGVGDGLGGGLGGGVAWADGVVAPPAGVVVPRAGVLNLRTGDVNTEALADALLLPAFEADARYVLVMDGPLTPGRREALARAGVLVRGYLPWQSVAADLSGTTPARVNELAFVRRVVAYDPAWKVDGVLRQGPMAWPVSEPERVEIARSGRMAANIWLFPGEDPAGALRPLAGMPGVRIIEQEDVGGAWRLGAVVTPEALDAVAGVAGVQFIEPVPEYAPRSNTQLSGYVQSDTTTGRPLHDRGLTGAGMVVGVIDGRPNSSHCSFADPGVAIGPMHRKILALNATPGSNDTHGTHVAATAVGDAGNSGDTRGVAFGAKMVHNTWPTFGSGPSMLGRLQLHRDQGATIHTNSWGTTTTAQYDAVARAIDVFSRDNDGHLVLFAVANNSATVRNPENAKNCLAVAATTRTPDANARCSGSPGPTLDGRQKPEVMAPGCEVSSASASVTCGLSVLSGTSMATPAVAGAAALLREYFMDGFYPSGIATPADARTPSGPLLKAMLANGTRDLTGIEGYPSLMEGWGRVVADDAAYFVGQGRRLIVRDVRGGDPGAMQTGGMLEVPIFVDGSGQTLRVTLAFHDAPAVVATTYTPVNDLDLVVRGPDGSVYLGNVFLNGRSDGGGVPDAINNLEQVLVPEPAPGWWVVEVRASAVNEGPQGFAWVATGQVLESNPCPADFDGSGGVADIDDILAFFEMFNAGDIRASVDGVGTLPDIDDILWYFDAFNAGCS